MERAVGGLAYKHVKAATLERAGQQEILPHAVHGRLHTDHGGSQKYLGETETTFGKEYKMERKSGE
jgi:hypothetical protein